MVKMLLPDDPHSRVIEVAILTIVAALLRVGMLLATVDVPGDGPVRALTAYSWARSPHVVLHGIWLPGFVYLTGLVSYVLPVWIAGRLFNAIVGTATVPMFFEAVAPVFGPSAGLIGAALIAVFPLHVGLSASSLTEVSAVFEILMGMAFLRMATQAEGRGRGGYATVAISSLVMASMTRYEVWFLLPLFPWYYWLRARDWGLAAGMAALLGAFPLAWLIGNHVYEGNALLGFAAAVTDRSFGETHGGVSLTKAVEILVTRFATHMGWVLVSLVILGLAMELRSLVARRLSTERLLYLAVVLVSLAGMGAFTVLRGETLGDRNLLFGLILLIPMAVIPVAAVLGYGGRGRLWVVIVVVVSCTLGSSWLTGRIETRWVTRVKPHGITRLAEWVNASSWRDQPVVFTRMDWQPTYVPYYFPRLAGKTLIVSEWIEDGRLNELTKLVRPALLVTQRGDEAYVERFSRVTGMAVEHERLVHRDGDVEVYELGNAPQNK